MVELKHKVTEESEISVINLVNRLDKFLDDFILSKELAYRLMSEDFATGKHEYKIMNILSNHPDASVGFIAEKIRLDISTVTAILNNISTYV